MNRKTVTAAFSLVELLTVVAILAFLIAATVMVINGPLRNRAMTEAGDLVAGQLALARQSALSENAPVRWELIEMADPRNGDAAAYRLIRRSRFDLANRRWERQGPLLWLPIGITADTEHSSLLEEVGSVAIALPDEPEQNASAAVITFYPSGESSLNPSAVHTLTLHRPQEASLVDFITITIDPLTGQTRFFRP